MNIFEIDQGIRDCIDMETGEVLDVKRLEALEMARERKIEGAALLYKESKMTAVAIAEEIKMLKARKKSEENRVKSLGAYLDSALQGEKFNTPKVSVSYRKSDGVEFDEGFDPNSLPEEYRKVTVEPRVEDLKRAIKESGAEFEGVYLAERSNIQVR